MIYYYRTDVLWNFAKCFCYCRRKKELIELYYAGYLECDEVAMFTTSNERDAWLSEDSLFDRVKLTEKEAYDIVGDDYLLERDDIVSNIIWMTHPRNIISNMITLGKIISR